MDAIINKILDILVDNIWNSLVFWRIIGIVLILSIALVIKFRKNIIFLILTKNGTQHDSDIFNKSNAILSERKLADILNWLQTNKFYFDDQSSDIKGYLMFFEEEGNQFISKSLLRKSKLLQESMNKLFDFLVQHFFSEPSSIQSSANFKYFLYPELDPGRHTRVPAEDAKIYFSCLKQLDEIINDVRIAYREYRIAVKKQLYI